MSTARPKASVEIVLGEAIPGIYRINYVALGERPRYPEMREDGRYYGTRIAASMLLAWTQLWLIKWSLMALFYRLMAGLPAQRKWWWVVLGYTIVTYLYIHHGNYLCSVCPGKGESYTLSASSGY